MLILKLSPSLAVLATCTTTVLALGGHPSVASLQTLGDRVDILQRSLDRYTGGFWPAIPVGLRMLNTRTAVDTVRKDVDASEPLSDEDGRELMELYNTIHPRILDALQTGTEKASDFKNAGAAPIANALLNSLAESKQKFADALKEKSPTEYFQNQKWEEVEKMYKNTMAAFAN